MNRVKEFLSWLVGVPLLLIAIPLAYVGRLGERLWRWADRILTWGVNDDN